MFSSIFRFASNNSTLNIKMLNCLLNKFSYIQRLRQTSLSMQIRNPSHSFNSSIVFSLHMRIHCGDVQFLFTDPSSTNLLKSTWSSIELQTNFQQRLLISITNCSIDFNDRKRIDLKRSESNGFVLDLIGYLKQQRVSNLHSVDSNLISESQPIQSNNIPSSTFDQWVEYLRDPFVNVSIQHFDIHYTTMCVFYAWTFPT